MLSPTDAREKAETYLSVNTPRSEIIYRLQSEGLSKKEATQIVDKMLKQSFRKGMMQVAIGSAAILVAFLVAGYMLDGGRMMQKLFMYMVIGIGFISFYRIVQYFQVKRK